MSLGLEISAPREEPAPAYRALSTSAVATLLLGALSALALLDSLLVVVPLVGIGLGLGSLRIIRRQSEELSGRGVARVGIALCVVFFTASVARHSWIYATEVPPGYERISYDRLQPDPDRPEEILPAAARALDGKKVFIKGYPLAGSQQTGIKQFVLVRDQGDCCFGGNPKITDQIGVTLAGGLTFDYDLRMLRIAGTFRVHPDRPVSGLGGPL
jgi:hypothetical protein